MKEWNRELLRTHLDKLIAEFKDPLQPAQIRNTDHAGGSDNYINENIVDTLISLFPRYDEVLKYQSKESEDQDELWREIYKITTETDSLIFPLTKLKQLFTITKNKPK